MSTQDNLVTAAHISPDAAVEVDDLVPSTVEAAVEVSLPYKPTTAESAVQASAISAVHQDNAANNVEIENEVENTQVISDQVLWELDDEVCPDVICNLSNLQTLLKNMSTARNKLIEEKNEQFIFLF